MENNLSTSTESEEPNSASQVVADVLAQKTKKNKFLRNVRIWNGMASLEVECGDPVYWTFKQSCMLRKEQMPSSD
jgi:hypothetical protein